MQVFQSLKLLSPFIHWLWRQFPKTLSAEGLLSLTPRLEVRHDNNVHTTRRGHTRVKGQDKLVVSLSIVVSQRRSLTVKRQSKGKSRVQVKSAKANITLKTLMIAVSSVTFRQTFSSDKFLRVSLWTKRGFMSFLSLSILFLLIHSKRKKLNALKLMSFLLWFCVSHGSLLPCLACSLKKLAQYSWRLKLEIGKWMWLNV